MSSPEPLNTNDSLTESSFLENAEWIGLSQWLDGAEASQRVERILIASRQVLFHLSLLHAQRKIYGQLTPNAISISPASTEVQLRPVDVRTIDRLNELESIQEACYLAPEQTGVLNRPATPATDLYTVGLLLVWMVTGRNPLSTNNLNDLLVRQMTWIPTSLRSEGFSIPRALDEMILRLVKRDASERYQQATAVLHDIDLLMEQPTSESSASGIAIGTTDHREKIGEPSFVGRSTWIANFNRRIHSDLRISHSPWLIYGSTGIGKSRLINEFTKEATSRSMIVLRATGSQSDLSRPLEAVSAIIKDIESACACRPELADRLRRQLHDQADSLQSLMPWLWEASGKRASEVGPESFAGRRLKQALQSFLSTLGQVDERIILLIDDLDRCDEMSRGLFTAWIQSQQQKLNGGIVFVATMNVEAEFMFNKPGGILHESLNGLSDVETTQLLKSMAGDFPLEGLSLISSAAHGNPYMAISLLYGMIESGTASSSSSGWKIRNLSLESLQGHRIADQDAASRMQSLSVDSRRFLSAAAILGRNCGFQEARLLARLSETDAQLGLVIAVQRQLIWTDASHQNLGFVHDKIRESFLDELASRDRIALHLRAARMIQGDANDRCFELAYHFDAAGHAKEAIAFSLRAARESQLRYATDLAIRYYQIALRWIPSEDKSKTGEVTEALAEVYLGIGEYDSAEKAYLKGLKAVSDRLSKMRMIGKLGDVEFKRGHMQKAAERYAQALALGGVRLPRTSVSMFIGLLRQVVCQTVHSAWGVSTNRPIAQPMQRFRWNLFSRLAHTYWFSRGALWTLMAHLQGMNEAECYADTSELAKAYSDHAPVCSLLGQFRRGEEYAKRSLRIRIEMNDLWGQGQTLSYSSVVQLAATRFEEGVRMANEAVELLQKTGDAWETNMARYQGALGLYRLGRFREAAEAAQLMHLSGVEIGDDQAAGISLDILMRTAPGMIADSSVESQAAIGRTDAQSHAQTRLALAILRLRQARHQEAVDVLIEAIARCRKAGHLNAYISPTYVWLATASRMLLLATPWHDMPLFRARWRQSKQYAKKAWRVAKKLRADLPHALRELGWQEVLSGRLPSAARLFNQSLTVARELDSPMEEFESLRCMFELVEYVGEARFPISIEHRERMRFLQSNMADAIALISDAKQEQASLSLVDRFDKLLEDGRRIAGSLNKEAIFTEGCMAAQHLLRGQMVFLFENANSENKWTIAHHLSSQANVCQLPKLQDYHRFILETCEAGNAKIFSTQGHNGLASGSLIAVPIRSREVIVACLAIEHAEIENLFGQAELQVAEFIATLTGAALENAEGFESLRDLNTTLEQRVTSRTEELREAMAIAVAASQTKSQFLATMSHEVRTPLNGILGMTRLALAKCHDTQQSNYLNTIQRSGESLLHLLNDLLDFSKIEAGKMTVESIPFDPRQMLSDVIGLMSASAWQKGLEVIATFDPQLPEQLLGDGVRLRQIVSNLVGNAIKFTDKGHIEIRADVIDSDVQGARQWRICVLDTGIGIPQDKQASIFEAFSQADGTTTRRFGGTGLGLSISVELVKMMNGTIRVESQEQVGSQFSVDLPLLDCQQPASRLHSCRLPDFRVIVLEPNTTVRRGLEQLLENWGADVVTIDSWSQLDDRDSIDLSLFNLAILSGPEASTVAELSEHAKVKTWIIHSPDTQPTSSLLHLCKPILPCELVRQFVELAPNCKSALPAPLSPTNAATTASTVSPSSLSTVENLRVLVAEDGEINRMVLVGLLELLGHTTIVVENGLQATERAANDAFDICLMDLDMPEMDGVEATCVIRSSGNALAIYAMTAHHDEHHAQLCRDAGMNGYLTKPIQADQLKQILASVASNIAAAAG